MRSCKTRAKHHSILSTSFTTESHEINQYFLFVYDFYVIIIIRSSFRFLFSSLWCPVSRSTGSSICVVPDVLRDRMCGRLWLQPLPVRTDQSVCSGRSVGAGLSYVLCDRDEGPVTESAYQRHRSSVTLTL